MIPEPKDPQRSADPNDRRNAATYHTGEPCIEPGCDEPAGTAWSPLWCWRCNADRLDRIAKQMDEIEEYFRRRAEGKT